MRHPAVKVEEWAMLLLYRRRAILVAVLLLAVGVGLFLWLTHDPLEAARPRVQLGTDQATVTAAVGRPPDSVFRHTGEEGANTLLRWGDGDRELYVLLDRHGLATDVLVAGPDVVRPLWERVRGCWPW